MRHQPTTPTLDDLHALARKGQLLFARNNDPLTAHAAEILFKATSLPLTRPQQNAAIVLNKQVLAYETLYTEPLA